MNNNPKPPNSNLNEEQDPNLSPTQLLKLAENQLHAHNFTLCHQYALKSQQLQQNDPNFDINNIHATQLLTMSNILINPKDYYSILKVPTFCNDLALIKSQFDLIVSIIEPIKDHFFLGQEALNLVYKAYGCLCDESMKSKFDFEFFGQRSEKDDVGSAKFWTFCPYCYYMYEFSRVYEGCCLRCQNEGCRRAFHGVSLNCGPKLGFEKEGFFGCFGYFPLGFSNNEIGKKFDSWSPIVGFSPMEKKFDGKFNFNDIGTNHGLFNHDYDVSNESFEESDDDDDESWNGDHGGGNVGKKKRKSMSWSGRKSRSVRQMINEGVGVGGEGYGEENGGEGEGFVGDVGDFEAHDVAIFEEDGEIFVGLGSDGGI